MTHSLEELKRIHAQMDEHATLEELDAPHPLSIPKTFPAANAITVMTFNFFDNGDVKSKWVSARYAMNLQVFTLTEPFSPTADLAAWTGTVQLHSTSFVGRYLTARHEEHEPIARPIIAETDRLKDRYNDILLGQIISKNGGTHYEWGVMLRTFVDDLGEFGAELVHRDTIIPAQDFTTINDPRRPKLKMVGRYDPLGLWQSKTRTPRTKKPRP